MVHSSAADLAHIGEALVSLRAAIDVVVSHAARRVTVHVVFAEQILPAARALGRTAGVTVEPVWWADDAGCDIVISSAAPGDG